MTTSGADVGESETLVPETALQDTKSEDTNGGDVQVEPNNEQVSTLNEEEIKSEALLTEDNSTSVEDSSNVPD